MFKEKKLYKSDDKKISGVCAGIAEFFEIDPTIVRLIFAVASIFFLGIGGLLVYAVLAFVMPQKPFPDYQYNDFEENRPTDNQ